MLPMIQQWVDKYLNELGNKQTLMAMLSDLHGPALLAAFLEILKIQTDPRLMVNLLLQWETWLRTEIGPELYAEPASSQLYPTPAPPAVTIESRVHMDDVIQLAGTTEFGQGKLQRFGSWWKVLQAYDYDRRHPAPSGRQPSWYVRSLLRKEQGLPNVAGPKFDVMWLLKQGDPHFQVINICAFPREFKHKEWKE